MGDKKKLLWKAETWFVHSVEPNQSDKERISISFNIMFSPYAEIMGAPKWRWDIDVDKDKA